MTKHNEALGFRVAPPERRMARGNRALFKIAEKLDIHPAALLAVSQVESRRAPFLPDGRPVILFEAHVFSVETGGRFDESHPGLSSSSWNRELYGPAGENQYARLSEAFQLDARAALRSASWGRFQIMGFNHEIVGFPTVEAFVQSMFNSEVNHLRAAAKFIEANHLVGALRNHDWEAFARGYNGPGYSKNNYHAKLRQAFQGYASRVVWGPRDAQRVLLRLGYLTGPLDGIWGPKSRASAVNFVEALGLPINIPPTNSPSRALCTALQAANAGYHLNQ